MNPLSKRLELIKNAIILEEEELIASQITRLEVLPEDTAILAIIDSLKQQRHHQALQQIDQYLSRESGLVLYEGGEVNALRLELKGLEREVQQLSEQYDKRQFLLDQFNYRYQRELGDLIQKALDLRQQISHAKTLKQQQEFEAQQAEYRHCQAQVEALKKQRDELEEKQKHLDEFDEFDEAYEALEDELEQLNETLKEKQAELKEERQRTKEAKESLETDPEHQEYKEAQQDYQEFNETYEETLHEQRADLNKEQTDELKQLFRKAARLCHPDTVTDELKEQATQLMQELNEARKCGDIATVQDLYEKLKQGVGFVVASDKLTDKKQLRAKISQLRDSVDQLKSEIASIEDSDTWQQIPAPELWDEHLAEMKQIFEEEISRLKAELIEPEVSPESPSPLQNPLDDEESFWQEEF